MRIRLHSGAWSNFGSFTLTGAGAVIGATAQQDALQLIGWCGMAFGLCVLVWGVTIDGEHWWAAPSLLRRRQWMPLHRALRYVALRSAWAFEIAEGKPVELDSILKREFGEHLARGDVSARGRTVISNVPYRLTETTEPIPQDFWPTAFFQPFGEIVICEDGRGAAHRDGTFHQLPACSYREIVVDMNQVRQTWPMASRRLSRRTKSSFHRALLRYWNGDYQGDGGFSAEFDMWAK